MRAISKLGKSWDESVNGCKSDSVAEVIVISGVSECSGVADESTRLVYHLRSWLSIAQNLSRRDSITAGGRKVASTEMVSSVRSIRPGNRAIISRRWWKSDFGALCHGMVSHSSSPR